MGIELVKYVKIKDNYCLIYFGSSREYLVQLRLLRPILEKKFHGLNLYVCCKDEEIDVLGGEKSLTMSELRTKRNKFAHVYEFLTGNQVHPIEELLDHCDIKECPIEVPEVEPTTKCVIAAVGSYPTKNLTKSQIQKLKNIAATQRYEVGEGLEGAGWVIGVESEELFEAAGKGIKTTLVKTGTGHNLYKKMFPQGEVMEI
tara:strand:- start:15505 stop:16107 length:603 start_codon:yes stop_codon:yes gene_type:complete